MMEDERLKRLKLKTAEKREQETRAEIERLRARADWRPELEPFAARLELGPPAALAELGRPVMAVMCLTVPLELVAAHGFHPYRLQSGHFSVEGLSAPRLPTVMCPMLRSTLGSLMIDGLPWAGAVFPTMCDWVVRIGDLLGLCGLQPTEVHRLETPHVKTCLESRERWRSELARLDAFLGRLSGRKLERRRLAEIVAVHQRAFEMFSRLIDLKRDGRLAQIWFSAVAAAFFLQTPEKWTADARTLVETLSREPLPTAERPKIFLAGSPIFFPNFKLLRLLEETGLDAVVDDLCSSERLLAGPVRFGDKSLHGLTTALAQRYFLGCLCPTFADNELRINAVVSPERQKLHRGAIFHVLKGCHCYELESLALEDRIKQAGLRFLRLETDYSQEDWATLSTRLEAFRSSL
jgi:benzoyl-CoA reductase/2-hydroxyglutaryl-CoA dehydratase subunit BcrC/BadD/HgdB